MTDGGSPKLRTAVQFAYSALGSFIAAELPATRWRYCASIAGELFASYTGTIPLQGLFAGRAPTVVGEWPWSTAPIPTAAISWPSAVMTSPLARSQHRPRRATEIQE